MLYTAVHKNGARINYEAKSVRDAMAEYESEKADFGIITPIQYWVSEYTTIHAPWNLLEDVTYTTPSADVMK